MRRLLFLSSLLPAVLLAQGQPPALRVPGLSPAGVAALDKLRNRQDPAVPKQVADETAARQQMAAVLGAPTVDVDKLGAALERSRVVAASGRKIMNDHILIMMRALPAGDRKAFLQAVANPQPATPAGPAR